MGTQAQNDNDNGNTVLIKDRYNRTLTTATVLDGNHAVTEASNFGKNEKVYDLYINGICFRMGSKMRNEDGELVAWVYLPTIGSPTDSGINKLTVYND